MKRVAMGCVWYMVLWLAALFEAGVALAIVGRQAGTLPDAKARHDASHAFGARYALLIFLVPLVVAIVGTLTGFLPGTARKVRPSIDQSQSP